MIKDVFIETKNVTRFRKAINGLVARHRLQPGFMVVEGESGRGKSMAADNWYSVNGGHHFRVWENMTQRAFLQELAHEVVGARPSGAHVCKRLIVDRLGKESKPIIIDEADRLTLPRIEDLRDINEASGAAIVLIGEEGLMGKLSAKQRIYSRVAEVVHFDPVSQDDVLIYGGQMTGLKISPDAAVSLVQKSGGSFRMIHNFILTIAEYAEANKISQIETSHISGLNLRTH